MFPFKYPVPQSDPPRSPRETLPTMYDLPSEDPEEPGLPDEFHDLQPQLLTLAFRPHNYQASEIFSGTDMNLYYDVQHTLWHKRPDWFGVVGVPRLYNQSELRMSYVTWQEGVNPFVIVELLSPGTEKEDLGANIDEEKLPIQPNNVGNAQVLQADTNEKPPSKWEVYEQILRVPIYAVFSRYTNRLRVFALNAGHYQELELSDSRVWIPDLGLGLGLWQGEFQGIDRLWLRWYDVDGNWILTEAEQQRQRADSAEAQLQSLIQRLRESGIDPDRFLNR
ncbi:Uma2 family endonuclease [Microcoleus sp. CAWBG58]|uniref:Uma2 family endonuclease n=1 Tax=Microcoleus sp. CAWBG58 TaxID=2841651 RepID=UPI0025CCB16E|nr:Uma2 family endonuclease [Microcoleus sp. CAWBG58]